METMKQQFICVACIAVLLCGVATADLVIADFEGLSDVSEAYDAGKNFSGSINIPDSDSMTATPSLETADLDDTGGTTALRFDWTDPGTPSWTARHFVGNAGLPTSLDLSTATAISFSIKGSSSSYVEIVFTSGSSWWTNAGAASVAVTSTWTDYTFLVGDFGVPDPRQDWSPGPLDWSDIVVLRVSVPATDGAGGSEFVIIDNVVAVGVDPPGECDNSELVSNGTFDSAADWTFYDDGRASNPDPTNGIEIADGKLHIWNTVTDPDVDVNWWAAQELTLEGGVTYDVSGHWAQTESPTYWWAHFQLTTTPPVNGTDPSDADNLISANGPWGEINNPIDKDLSAVYTAPGTGPVTVYALMKSGVWDNAFDFTLDNLSVKAQCAGAASDPVLLADAESGRAVQWSGSGGCGGNDSMAVAETIVTDVAPAGDSVSAYKLEWTHPDCTSGGGWNGHRWQVPGKHDLSGHDSISFWAKGNTVGNINIRVFSDRSGNTDWWREGVQVSFTVSPDWTLHTIPKGDFTATGNQLRPIDWTAITGAIEFAAWQPFDSAAPGTVSTLYIDEVWAIGAGSGSEGEGFLVMPDPDGGDFPTHSAADGGCAGNSAMPMTRTIVTDVAPGTGSASAYKYTWTYPGGCTEGGQWSQVSAGMADAGTDVSSAEAITFWAKGTDGAAVTLRVFSAGPNADWKQNGSGQGFTLTPVWTKYTLPLADFTKLGWLAEACDFSSLVAVPQVSVWYGAATPVGTEFELYIDEMIVGEEFLFSGDH